MLSLKLKLNWASYRPYTWSNVQSHAPTSGGVYKLAYPDGKGQLNVFYVGQADDLDQRLKQHLADSETNQCIRGKLARHSCQFAYASVASQTDRDGAERSLYDHYRPSCNVATPPGRPIAINVR